MPLLRYTPKALLAELGRPDPDDAIVEETVLAITGMAKFAAYFAMELGGEIEVTFVAKDGKRYMLDLEVGAEAGEEIVT